MGGTRGTETSKYPEEEKEKSIPKVAASEMERAQTEGLRTFGVRTRGNRGIARGRPLESGTGEGKSPVDEAIVRGRGSGVPQDTRNPVGRRGDHPPRLNTTW